MDEEIVKQILDELFLYPRISGDNFHAFSGTFTNAGYVESDTGTGAGSDEVRWRAARVRMGALLASALKTPEPAAEKKTTAAPAKQEENGQSTADVDTKEAEGQSPEPKSEGPKNEARDAAPAQDAVENTDEKSDEKSQDKNDEGATTRRKPSK